MENFNKEFEKFSALYRWFHGNADNIQASNINQRKIMALACYKISIEHQAAIHMLMKRGIHGAAFTLHRTAFESFVRGLWLEFCATDDEIEKFRSKDTIEKSIGGMITAIEKNEGLTSNELSGIKEKNWSKMCSFSHSGIQAISRQINGNILTSNYSEDDLVGLSISMRAMLYSTSSRMFDIAGEIGLFEEVMRKSKDDFSE